MIALVPLIIAAILALLVPFAGVVIFSSVLLVACKPQSRWASVVCFLVPALVVPAVLIAANSSNNFWRYSAQGPIIWFIVWPVLVLVAVGVIGAAFAIASIRKKLPLS